VKTSASFLLLLLSGCAGSGKTGDYGDPTVPSDPNALVLTVDAPVDFTESSVANIQVTGSAHAGNRTPSIALSAGSTFNLPLSGNAFSGTASLAHGDNTLQIAAILPSGERSDVFRHVSYTGTPPGVVWIAPAGTNPVGGATAPVALRTTAASGRTISSVAIDAGGTAPNAALGDDLLWHADVPLPSSGSTVTLHAVVTDSAGESTETSRTYVRDPQPPSITISTPTAGQVLETSTFDVTGTADDDMGLRRVEVRVGNADPEPATGTTQWTAHLFLDPGTQTITATAYDISGQKTESSVTVTVARVVTLRPPNTSGDLTLTVDRNGLMRLIPDDSQKTITLLYVDLAPVMTAGLDAIKDPVASGLDTSSWGPAEQNMQRLLNMSPDNANLSGTALEPVLTLAPNIGLPPARLLANIAGVNVTDPFLSSSDVTQAILRDVIYTHPAIEVDPADGQKKVRTSLYDALRDCTPLAPRFGPAGAHPGFLTGTTFARVLKNNFAMTITAKSNLAQHDGINPSVGKAYLFVADNPDQQSLITFDFLDPARFQVAGIADEPNIDMTFFMNEAPTFIPGGTVQMAGADGMFFQGNSPAWGLSPWLIEHLVIDAVYNSKRDRFATDNYLHTFSYAVGAINPAATVTWNKGWLTMSTAGGLGNPPAPAYFWDYLLEAGQKRLHDQGIPEGSAGVRFLLTRIPLGLTGDQLRDKLRPQMEAQKDDLARILLGDRSSYQSTATFYRVKGADNNDYLYFTAPGDVPGLSPYPYSAPGFFSDAALTQKASSTAAGGSGDSIHEKIAIAPGNTYYVRGADGVRYKIDLLDMTGSDLHVRVEAVGP
jgi:hypothetical protein